MKKIFTLLFLFMAIGQLATAQTVVSTNVSWQDMVAYEKAHPELVKACKTCPNKEADNGWEGLFNAEMPFPPGAIIKAQENTKGNNGGNLIAAASRPPLQQWLGHLDQGTIIPPDTHGAVGLNHVITATNNFIKIHAKSGGALVSQVTISTFTAIGNTCDPYMIFDPTAQRWIFSAIECTTNGNRVILMTSNTSDPTGTWRKVTWVPSGASHLLDHPYVGFDANMIVVSGRRFPSGYAGPSLYLIDKAAMYAGTAITFGTNAQQIDKTTADGDSPLPVTVYDPPYSTVGNPSPGTFYILQSWNGTSIRLSTVTGTIPAATWNTGSAIFPTGGTPWNPNGPTNSVQQMTETRLLSANDARISCGVMMNGKIWASHHIYFPASGTPDRIAVQWWELDGAPATLGNVIQRGRIGGDNAGEYKWFSSMAVNKDEDVLIGYSASSTTSHVNAAYVTRQVSTPANTTDDELIYHTGEDRYWKDFNSGRARWGDYSHSSLDPVDQSLWTIQEYAAPGNGTIPPDNNSRFGTWWAQVARSNAPAAPVITAGNTTITAESCAPANGVIDPNETVSISFCLQNVGTGNTVNLVGTLLATGGVTAPSGPQNYGVVIAGGAPVCKTFSFTANTTCGGTVTASIQLQDGATNLGTITYNFVTGAITTSFTQNFDAVTAPALPAGWVATNAAGPAPLWVTATGTVASAPNALFVDDPNVVSDKSIETPTIAIASAASVLSFKNNYTLESTFDGGVLEISINGGAYQDIITAGGVFTANGYNGVISNSFSNPLAGRSAWTGTAGSFLTSTVTLPAAAAGQNVKLRFRMGSDNSVSSTGWRVDDVTISDRVCCTACVPPSAATPPANTTACPTGTATFTVVAGGTAPFTYQWYESPTGVGGPFNIITNGGVNPTYSGATTATLTMTGVTAPMSGYAYRVVITGNCGSPATSTPAVLTIVATTTGGTITPASSSVCTLPNTGTLTLTGSAGSVLRWESSTVSATGPWTTIANTTTTLTYNNISQTTWYQAVVQAAGCVAANSAVAMVRANTGPLMIVADPGTTICEGDPTLLTVMNTGGASGPGNLYVQTGTQVNGSPSQVFEPANTAFNSQSADDFTVPVSTTWTITRVDANGIGTGTPTSVNVFFYANSGSNLPGAAVATFNNVTTFVKTGGNYSITLPSAVVLNSGTYWVSVQVNMSFATGGQWFWANFGTTNIGNQYAWQNPGGGFATPCTNWGYGATGCNVGGGVARNNIFTIYGSSVIPGGIATGTFLWTPAAGLSSTTSNPVAASPMNTTTYTVTVNDGLGCIKQGSILITVNKRPVVTSQPANSTNCAGTSASFTVGGTGTNLTYQWQISTTGPGGPWTNLTNVVPYSGATTATLTVNPVTVAMTGNIFRCVLSGACPAIGTANISTGAVLTVNALPVVTVSPATGCGGVAGTSGLLLTASGANTYTWSPTTGLFTNAIATIPYTGGNSATVYAAPTVFTAYTVTGTNTATGCFNSATTFVNYTPPPPTVTPSSVTMCLGDAAVRLTSSSSTSSSLQFCSGPISVVVPDATLSGATANLTVSGVPAACNVSAMSVTFNMSHTWDGDVAIALKAPNGNILNLDYYLSNTGGTGATTGFVNTTISSTGTAALSSGANPYTGTFRADASLATAPPSGPTGFAPNVTNWASLYSVPNGTWTLAMVDAFGGDQGTLTSWCINMTYVCGVPSTPATWSPIAGLFTDAAATIPYTGTPRDTVWTRPTPAGVYPYQVTVQSLPPAPLAFANTSLITINDGAANPYPANLVVSGLPTSGVTVKSVTISGINHTWSEDVDILLQSPTGQNVILISDIDGSGDYSGNTYTLDDAAPTTMAGAAPPPSGTYKPTNSVGAIGPEPDNWPAPGPGVVNQPNPTLSTFTGNMNGTWKLFVFDDAGGDVGTITGGYSVNFNLGTAACTSPARTVIVTVNQPTTLNANLPVNQTICTDKVATFSVAVTAGTGPHSYQWQVSTNGNNPPWTNISNGGVYSGATTATLTITAPPVTLSTNFYRCVVTGAAPCAAVNSNGARLIVNPLPTIVITANPYTSLFPGLTATLSSTVSPVAAQTYTWLRNGTAVANATTGKLIVDVDGLGDYTLRVTDLNGCTNTSNMITIKDSASGKCFIYPNPNSGLFQVRYFSVANNVLPRTLTVYDAQGGRVLTQMYTIGRPYDRMDVDMRAYGKGLYWVEIGDRNGNRLTMCRIVIQ